MMMSPLVLVIIIASLTHHALAGVVSDAHNYRPIYKFDGASKNYCYPDEPSKSNDGRCVKSLSSNTPAYVQSKTCGNLVAYQFYLWYGLQKPCIKFFDKGHGNDWERIAVFVDPTKRQVQKVVYHQHNGHYTRRRGEFQHEGERPVVYIGKIAHGSYHHQCDGRCSWTEFFRYGCVGTVNFCVGGCGYWEDFRNPGPTLRDYRLEDLHPGQTINGLARPDRKVCSLPDCEGKKRRSLFTSGCWQNKP